MTPEKRRASPLVEVSLLLTVFFFGTNFTAVKLVVESVPPILFAATRFTLAGLLLLPLALLSGPESHLSRRFEPRDPAADAQHVDPKPPIPA